MLQVPESSSTGSMFTSEGSRHGAGLQPQAGRDWWRDDLDMDSGSELSLLAEDFSTQGGDPVRFHPTAVAATYNWRNTSEPTIVVPGHPPVMKDVIPRTPFRLGKDSQENAAFVDENAARVPSAPLDPLVAAMHAFRTRGPITVRGPMRAPGAAAPELPVRVVSDRNNLRKLLAFVTGEGWYDDKLPLRIDVSVVEGALVMCRREPSAHGDAWAGYGHSFEEHLTQPCASGRDTAGYRRVVRDDWGRRRAAGWGCWCDARWTR